MSGRSARDFATKEEAQAFHEAAAPAIRTGWTATGCESEANHSFPGFDVQS